MTDPSEVKISDADKAFLIEEHAAAMCAGAENSFDAWIVAIKALIARRVPDAMAFKGVAQIVENPTLAFKIDAHNACRARVLDGE